LGGDSVAFQANLLPSDDLPIRVLEAPSALIDPIIFDHHYSHTVPPNRWMCFAVYHHSLLKGAMQIGYGIRPEMKQHIIDGANSETVKEFDRMWLSDDMPKNSESRVIGYMLRYLRKHYPELKALISYADGLRGKVGTIYQATNFQYIGAVPGEFYHIPSTDTWVHPVTMWHRHGTRARERLEALYPDIQHIRGDQHRYVYFLDDEWQNRLLQPILPYPKHAGVV